MALTDALKLVEPKWAGVFKRFVQTGDASDEFFAFLDSSANCQRAVDMVLERKSRGLERVSDLLRSEELSSRQDRPKAEQKAVYLAQALGVAARLSRDERSRVLRETLEKMRDTGLDVGQVKEVASELQHEAAVLKVSGG
jgi:hypothetical protein